MDNDGNVTENFAKQIHTIDFIPPREVISYANISEDKISYVNEIDQELDRNIYHRTSVFNNSLSAMSNVSMITVLPYSGDHSIVPDKTGIYPSRESQFSTPLIASLESVSENAPVLAKWDVFYSTENQGATTDAVRDARFVPAAQIRNWADVKMVKMVLKPGQILDIKEEVSFVMPARIPNNKTISAGAIARTSTAISFNGRDFIESASTMVRIARYTVSGKIFSDLNKNGQKDANEGFVSNHRVTIKNEQGAIIGTTMTNNNGEYSYEIPTEGKYFVEIAKKTNSDEFSPVVVNSTDTIVGNSATAE